MKKLLNLALITLVVTTSFAQRDPQYSFNMFNHMAVNPGFAGASGGVCARGIFHEQWIGFDDAPNTMVFSGDMTLSNINSGVGLNIIQDRSGFNNDVFFNGNYSYRLKVGDDGDLGIGLGLGFIQNSISGDWVTPDQLNDPNRSHTDDRIIPQQETKTKFDASLGAFYHTTFDKYNEMYAGVSMTHLTEPVFTTEAGGEGDLYKRTAYFTAGYYYTMPNGLVQLRPSVFVKSDFAASQMSFNLTALYNQMFWAGVTYRGSNDIGLMVGATLKSNISFGIAYDYHMSSDLNSPGSIDIMLKYCFSMKKKGGKTSHNSVRFL